MNLRRTLARRILHIVALSVPVAGLQVAMGCNTGCGEPIGDPEPVCIDPSKLAEEGIDGGTFPGACPTDEAARETIVVQSTTVTGPFEIQSGPRLEGMTCCYVIQNFMSCTGRPFLVAESPVSAPATAASGWSATGELLPRVDDLSAATRAALAAEWTRDGLFEHASVASFGRFALELLAVGAPADLVDDAHRAARDEVRHARLCLSLAGAYAGAPVGPGRFPFAGQVEVSDDLASIAARAVREGCVGETIAAVQAEEQLARATDPAVRAALAIIAADEARHAELAWRTVVWAIQQGGAPVRAAVAAALAGIEGDRGDDARREGALDAHGRLDLAEQRRIAACAVVEVIRPAARLLLSGTRVEERALQDGFILLARHDCLASKTVSGSI